MTIFIFIFYMGERRGGRRGIQTYIFFCCCGVWDWYMNMGCGKGYGEICDYEVGELRGTLLFFPSFLCYFALAYSFGRVFKRLLGMNHYRRGVGETKNMDYFLDQRCVEADLLDFTVDAAMHVYPLLIVYK
jgi:hypothetical protein